MTYHHLWGIVNDVILQKIVTKAASNSLRVLKVTTNDAPKSLGVGGNKRSQTRIHKWGGKNIKLWLKLIK